MTSSLVVGYFDGLFGKAYLSRSKFLIDFINFDLKYENIPEIKENECYFVAFEALLKRPNTQIFQIANINEINIIPTNNNNENNFTTPVFQTVASGNQNISPSISLSSSLNINEINITIDDAEATPETRKRVRRNENDSSKYLSCSSEIIKKETSLAPIEFPQKTDPNEKTCDLLNTPVSGQKAAKYIVDNWDKYAESTDPWTLLWGILKDLGWYELSGVRHKSNYIPVWSKEKIHYSKNLIENEDYFCGKDSVKNYIRNFGSVTNLTYFDNAEVTPETRSHIHNAGNTNNTTNTVLADEIGNNSELENEAIEIVKNWDSFGYPWARLWPILRKLGWRYLGNNHQDKLIIPVWTLTRHTNYKSILNNLIQKKDYFTDKSEVKSYIEKYGVHETKNPLLQETSNPSLQETNDPALQETRSQEMKEDFNTNTNKKRKSRDISESSTAKHLSADVVKQEENENENENENEKDLIIDALNKALKYNHINELFALLKNKGWKYRYPKKKGYYSGLADIIYFKPGFDHDTPNLRVNIDYFFTREAVIKYLASCYNITDQNDSNTTDKSIKNDLALGSIEQIKNDKQISILNVSSSNSLTSDKSAKKPDGVEFNLSNHLKIDVDDNNNVNGDNGNDKYASEFSNDRIIDLSHNLIDIETNLKYQIANAKSGLTDLERNMKDQLSDLKNNFNNKINDLTSSIIAIETSLTKLYSELGDLNAKIFKSDITPEETNETKIGLTKIKNLVEQLISNI